MHSRPALRAALTVLAVLLLAVVAGCSGGSPTRRASSTAPTEPVVTQGYVRPGQAGFLGDRSALKVVPDQGVPTGCTWDPALKYLECKGDAVIDKMYVKGGIDAYANLTITNSVVVAQPTNWVLVNERSAGGRCTITRSTLVFENGGHNPANTGSWGVGGINDMNGCVGDYRYNDISGSPDGIDTGADGTVIEYNYVHSLATVGSPPNETHNDGIQLFGCNGCTITGNYLDVGWDGVHQNSCFFESDGTPGRGIVFTDNYLSGGGYAFRNMIGSDMRVRGNTFHPLPKQFAQTLVGPAASFREWTDNRLTTGTELPEPRT